MFPREMNPFKSPLSDSWWQQRERYRFPFFLRPSRNAARRRTAICQPSHYIFEHNFFRYQTEEHQQNMFHERRRDWEARIERDALESQRSNSRHIGFVSRRSQSTLEPDSRAPIQPIRSVGQRLYGDREERRREKQYTSSAFDTIKPIDGHQTKRSPLPGDPCSPLSSASGSPSPRKMNLTIEIPEPKAPKQFDVRGKVPDDNRRWRAAGGNESPEEGNRMCFQRSSSSNSDHLVAIPAQRSQLRVTSNIERSLHPSIDSASVNCEGGNSMYFQKERIRGIDGNESGAVTACDKNLSHDFLALRHADRRRISRNEGLRPKATCNPDYPSLAGRAGGSKFQARRSSSHTESPNSSVVRTLSFESDDVEDYQHFQEDKISTRESSFNSNEDAALHREHSDFSGLSAESWRSIESEQELTEQETKLLTSSSSGSHQNTSSSSEFSSQLSEDHDPSQLFGVDCQGDLLERMSNDDPYCLSVLECCSLLQSGADISKKLGFNRYEQRRVWMSSDFLHLCWSSKKSKLGEDQIEVAQIARMKLTDKNLLIDMSCGYSVCFVFPSVTTAGLWVRALACLVPLQTNIKVPLGVIIPTETEREEFSLAEDTFANKHVREYMTVNCYVALCNSSRIPSNMGLKMAFSISEDRFYGLRYIPRRAIPHMLPTRKEAAILKTLKHKNIVQYHEILQDPEQQGMYVVFDHMSRGCVADSANLQRMQLFRESQVRLVMIDVINALLYLHTRRISHGDVRPENVLMTPNGDAKLNPIGCIMHDFNSIRDKTAHIRCRLGSSSHAFVAPEQCWLTRAPTVVKESTTVDVWGVGALMFTLIYGRTPYQGSNVYELQENICWGTLRFPLDPHVSKEAKSLMFQILSNKDPRTRMKMVEVRDHPWFRDYSILSPTSSRLRFPDYFESSINNSSMTDFSDVELSGAVQPAKVRITAKKKKRQGRIRKVLH